MTDTPSGPRRWPPRPTTSPSPGCWCRRCCSSPSSTPGLVGRVRRSGRSCASPTASTATWPAATAPPARARSSTRWPTRSWCSARCSRWWPSAVLGRAGGAHRRARGGHQHVPLVLGPPGAVDPGPGRRQAQDPGAAAGGGLRPASPRGQPRVARRRPAVGRRGAHRPKSSPSAPSCCSARSSTPTRPGSANSSPSPGSTATSRPRSATTPIASGRPRARARAQRRGDRVRGARPTQDDITRDVIAEVMGVELVRDEAISRPASGHVRGGAAPCRPTTSARPRCPGAAAHRSDARHRARPVRPGGRQGRLRRARGALRDEGDGRWHVLPDLKRAPASRRSSRAAPCAPGARASRAWPSCSTTRSSASTREGGVTSRSWPAASRA
jgi:hypothetical protein